MRFALATGQGTGWDALCGLWEAADQVELWQSAWTGDHFYPFLSDPSGPCMEGWVTLAALAQRTRRLRLGVLVSGMPYRHPAVLAKMAAALDVTCQGRLELGLGAAWYAMECEAYGIDLGPGAGSSGPPGSRLGGRTTGTSALPGQRTFPASSAHWPSTPPTWDATLPTSTSRSSCAPPAGASAVTCAR